MTATAAHRADGPAAKLFADIVPVADAILYEGYLLYPYRSSAPKNARAGARWQFGVLAPRNWIEWHDVPDPGIAGAAESWFQQAECLAEAGTEATLHVRLRFLQATERPGAADAAVPREFDVAASLAELTGELRVPVPVGDVPAELVLHAEQAVAPFPLRRLRIRVENRERLRDPSVPREVALRHALVATHLLVAVTPGRFVSLLDPPQWAADAARACENRHVYPVLGSRNDTVLCSPIILYDHPQIAPESPGDLHDAAEIDEILTLRTLALTEDEKREARATDPRAAAILDRVDAMPPEVLSRLHGAVRSLRPAATEPDPQHDSIVVAGTRLQRGSRVRLRPRRGGTDAFDLFVADRAATVHAVLRDVDGSTYLAVTVDDDPAAELHEWYGRFFHFAPDEVVPL